MAKLERPYFYTAIDLDLHGLGVYDSLQHITVTPPVSERGGEPIDDVVETMRKKAHVLGEFTIAVAGKEWFGPDNTIAVRTIADPGGMLALTHRRMLEALDEHGYYVDTTYTGDNYHPHTSLIENRPEPTGIIHVDSLVVARSLTPGHKELYATIPLHDI